MHNAPNRQKYLAANIFPSSMRTEFVIQAQSYHMVVFAAD